MISSVDVEAIENRLELEGVEDKKRKVIAFREAVLKRVPEAWRQAAFKPDGSVNPAPSIELVLRTFMTAEQAVASREPQGRSSEKAFRAYPRTQKAAPRPL